MSESLDPLYLVKALDKTPPASWRAMAIVVSRGRKARRLSVDELCEMSGIPRRTLIRALYRNSASQLKLEIISRISAACGVNLLSPNPVFQFTRSHPSGECEFLLERQKKRLEEIAAECPKPRYK